MFFLGQCATAGVGGLGLADFYPHGLVFVLIGLQPAQGVAWNPRSQSAGVVGVRRALSGLLIALRVFGFSPAHSWRTWCEGAFCTRKAEAPARQIFVVGWTGMPDVSLAAAIALPANPGE